MKTIALIDYSNLFAIRYHARGDDAAAARNDVVGYVRAKCHEFDSVVLCCDSPPYRRAKEFPAYKANRNEWPAGAKELRAATLEEVGKLAHVARSDGYEADDIIGSLVAWLCGYSHEVGGVVVFSDDKDIAQIDGWEIGQGPDAAVAVHRIDGRRRDVIGEFGVRPGQLASLLAMIGDKADNLPGIPGIGPKRGAQLLDRHGDLGAVRRAIYSEEAEQNFPSAMLASLRTAFDAPKGEAPEDILHLIELELDAPIEDIGRVLESTRPRPEAEPSVPGGGLTTLQGAYDDPTVAKILLDDPHAVGPQGKSQGAEDEPIPYRPTPEPEPSSPSSAHKGEIVAPPQARRSSHDDFARQLEPMDRSQARSEAQTLFDSHLFGVRSPQAAYAIIAAGRDYGMGATRSLMSLHIVEGRPELSAGLIHALCLKSSLCEYFDPIETTTERCTFETKRRGRPPIRLTWTMEDRRRVRAQEKPGSNWAKYPRAMLRARCVSELARMVYPDIVHNTYSEGEITDGE